MTATDTLKSIQTALNAFRKADPLVVDGIWGQKSQSALDEVKNQANLDRIAQNRPKYSPVFEAFFPFLMEWEGEYYENDPDDPGGETKFGIDKRSHPEVNIKTLTKEQAKAIYWQEWLDAGCDKLASPFAEVYFNCAVNMGLSRAKEFRTSSGMNPVQFLKLQEAKYRSLGESPSRKMFLKGWLNRTNALRKRFNI